MYYYFFHFLFIQIVSLAIVAVVAADVSHLNLSPLVKILRQSADVAPDGSYNYHYETENGIYAEESGQPVAVGPEGPAVVVKGSYRYLGDDGVTYEVHYQADENGFHPEGAHIPAVPAAIQRSLQINEAHPEVRIPKEKIKPSTGKSVPFRF